MGDDASARGNDGWWFRGQSGQYGRFPVAKPAFAFGGEDVWNSETGFLDDLAVGVDEWPVEFLGDEMADGGFSAAHESDEDDVVWMGHGWGRSVGKTRRVDTTMELGSAKVKSVGFRAV